MRIDDFIEATNTANTADEVFVLYERAIADYGYDRTMYCALRNHPASTLPAVAKNYPDDWISYYVEKGYTDTDPVRHFCITSRKPFTWAEIAKQVPKKHSRIFDEAREAGIRDGIGIPVHGPNGEAMGIGLASSSGNTDAGANLSSLHLLSLQFHTAYMALAMPEQSDTTPVQLTPREKEVLQWCVHGKSNWVIGELMSISEHAVDFHLRNIFRKLNANSRITAVVKALYLGIITL